MYLAYYLASTDDLQVGINWVLPVVCVHVCVHVMCVCQMLHVCFCARVSVVTIFFFQVRTKYHALVCLARVFTSIHASPKLKHSRILQTMDVLHVVVC